MESAVEEVAECRPKKYPPVGLIRNGELVGRTGLRPMYGNINRELPLRLWLIVP
jgi:hypothetical protein